MKGPSFKRPRTAAALYRNSRYAEADLKKKKEALERLREEREDHLNSGDDEEVDEGVDEGVDDEEEDSQTFTQSVKAAYANMAREEKLKWIDLEAIQRYDSQRALYGPHKVYGVTLREEAVEAVKFLNIKKPRNSYQCYLRAHREVSV